MGSLLFASGVDDEAALESDNLVLGDLCVDVAFTDRPVPTVYLSVIVRRIGHAWPISHYQVSRLA